VIRPSRHFWSLLPSLLHNGLSRQRWAGAVLKCGTNERLYTDQSSWEALLSRQRHPGVDDLSVTPEQSSSCRRWQQAEGGWRCCSWAGGHLITTEHEICEMAHHNCWSIQSYHYRFRLGTSSQGLALVLGLGSLCWHGQLLSRWPSHHDWTLISCLSVWRSWSHGKWVCDFQTWMCDSFVLHLPVPALHIPFSLS